jgi:NADP-dependent 3-hydroxy acid dehydrogenase YdfG
MSRRVAIITGASTGIGHALARELGKRGWAVGLLARRGELLADLAGEIAAAGGHAAFASADVTDRAATESAIAQLQADLGPADLLVANAGGSEPSPAQKVPVDAILRVMQLNYAGVVHGVGAVLPGMLARKRGHLAVVSSVASFRGMPTHGAYCASKAAVSTLFESFRIDLRGSGIAVTTIHPGFVETPLTAKNRQPMPFLMTAERAARIIADGLEKRRADITFPWQLRILMGWILRWTPPWIWDRVVAGPARRYEG